MSRWFRMYDDLLDNPKVQRLPPVLFKAWVNLLCLASRNDGALPGVEDVAFALREQPETVGAWLTELTGRGLIDEVDGQNKPHNWDKRQFKSDSSTERSRKHREAKQETPTQQECNVAETADETPPDTEQSRTETDKVLSEASSDPKPKKARVAYSAEFDLFWKAYPTDTGMSKLEAWKAWEKLSPDDRGHATNAIPAFKAWVSKQGKDYRTVHACRYLSQRRFDGFAEAGKQAGTVTTVQVVLEGTPEWDELKKSRPRLVARDIQTPNGIVRGEYGRAA